MTDNAGEQAVDSLSAALAQDRERLRRMVELRMDARLRGRLDASDVLQEAFVEATKRWKKRDESLPQYVWLRFITMQKLTELHRVHLKVKSRSARREAELPDEAGSLSTQKLAELLAASSTSPGSRVARVEMRERIRAALDELEPISREVLGLRHFEQLSGAETAHVLGISASAASKRYLRALDQIKKLLPELR